MPEGVQFTGPVSVKVRFFLPRPSTVRREYPSVYPDLDKLVRSTLDALNKGVIDDDSRIVDLDAKKRYVTGNGFMGARIWIAGVNDDLEEDEA